MDDPDWKPDSLKSVQERRLEGWIGFASQVRVGGSVSYESA